MKKILKYLFTIVGFLSFCYYCSKFYTYRGLEYDEKYIPLYIIVFLIIGANFIFSIINSHKIDKQSVQIDKQSIEIKEIKEQNEDIKKLIIRMYDDLRSDHDNHLDAVLISREFLLEISEKLERWCNSNDN